MISRSAPRNARRRRKRRKSHRAKIKDGDSYAQVGINSRGPGCGVYPNVYTDVSAYRDWIDEAAGLSRGVTNLAAQEDDNDEWTWMETDAADAAGGLSRLALAWAAVIAWVAVADDAEELEELHDGPKK